MKGLESSTYLLGYIISNMVGLIFLLAAIKKPVWARLMFALLFTWACGLNYVLSHSHPEAYLNYANASVKWYGDFIHGWFSEHVTSMVTLISIGQGMIAIGMLLKEWWVKLACSGAIIFLLAIAPLGVYAAFPFSLTVSLAAWFIIKKNKLDYIWKYRTTRKKIIYE